MKLRDFAIGVAAGLATAILIKEISDRKQPYTSADDVLKQIKEQFSEAGKIEGSWVYMKPEQFKNEYTTTPVYRGGITQNIDGEVRTFEFAADAYNGILLEVKEA